MLLNDSHIAKVGSKGELFLPKKMRRKLGLEPGRKVLYYIKKGRLVVEPIATVKSILSNNTDLVEVSQEELEIDRSQ